MHDAGDAVAAVLPSAKCTNARLLVYRNSDAGMIAAHQDKGKHPFLSSSMSVPDACLRSQTHILAAVNVLEPIPPGYRSSLCWSIAGPGPGAPRAVARVSLTGGPVPVIWIYDTRVRDPALAWHLIPIPTGWALWGSSRLWGHRAGDRRSPYIHAVPLPAPEHGPCLPSAVLPHTPAFHYTP